MSQTTCCPACQTLFKVVPDQLRVSGGWVRCGQCSEIFDAHLHLYKEPFSPDPPRDAGELIRGPSDAVNTLGTGPVPLRVQRQAEPDVQTNGASFDATLVDTPQAPLPVQQVVAEPHANVSHVPGRRGEARAGAGTDSGEVLSEALPEVTFLRAPSGNAFWGRAWVRTSLMLAVAGLASTLALQAIVHQRDRIAATVPVAKPAVEGLCHFLGCRVLPLRQIESLVIDGSTFTELRGNAYRLGFTVKNIAAIDLAMPAIELTLTDSQDRAALRRVFLPAEMGATSAVLGAGTEWAGTLVLSVRTNGASERVSGYRLSATYP